MSFSSAQYDKFCEQTVTEWRAFTFSDDGELLVYRVSSGETVPFWSSRSRLETIQRRLPKYGQWQITELSFQEFWRRLNQLEGEGVQVGANWSGQELTGYNVPVAEFRKALEYWIDRLGKRALLDLNGRGDR